MYENPDDLGNFKVIINKENNKNMKDNKDVQVPFLLIIGITLITIYLIVSFIIWDFTWIANCGSEWRFLYISSSLITSIVAACCWNN